MNTESANILPAFTVSTLPLILTVSLTLIEFQSTVPRFIYDFAVTAVSVFLLITNENPCILTTISFAETLVTLPFISDTLPLGPITKDGF